MSFLCGSVESLQLQVWDPTSKIAFINVLYFQVCNLFNILCAMGACKVQAPVHVSRLFLSGFDSAMPDGETAAVVVLLNM
jgi:hypothetical protein